MSEDKRKPRPTSINLDPKLLEMADQVITIRQLAGEKVSRSRLVTEALVLYLDQFRHDLIAQAEAVSEQIAAFKHELELE